MDRIDRNSPPTFPFNYFPCLKPLWERVQSLANYFYTQFMDFYWGKPLPKENPYDVARLDESLKERDLARDIAAWEGVSIAVDNLVNGIFNLSGINKPLERAHPSGFPPFMQVGNYQHQNYILGIPYLSVVLPRRQIACFPKPLQDHLLRFSEEELELQFVIFKKPLSGSADFSLIFHHLFFSDYPHIGKKQQQISVGLFGGQGIKKGIGRSIPWEKIQKDDIIVHTDGESYFHSPDNLRIQMEGKVGTFYVGASYINCNDSKQNRAYGVMGVILDLDDVSDVECPALSIEQRVEESRTLKEFVDGCGGEIRKLFTFNPDY
ncbi:MAG: hypothetical protein KFB93_00570 [Simkaniaceae bacterium]|nr:MAG: hypothetical protein KFB93_00570 [Simkaniaceae bacterium]